MKTVAISPQQMKDAEAAAFAAGVPVAVLMEEAGLAVARVVHQFCPRPGKCIAFVGKGNNGGDALVAARHLLQAGWQVEIDCAYAREEMSPAAAAELQKIGEASAPAFPPLEPVAEILLDGLLGLGASGEPRAPIDAKIRAINERRQLRGSRVFAVDFPSGLDPAGGKPAASCVRADVTVALGACKSGLVADAATDFVGRLALAGLPHLDLPDASGPELGTAAALREWLPPRNFDSHKGSFGRVAIIAGSVGYFGAAKLCCLGALHGGAGLVTLLAKPKVYPYLATDVAPEAMVQPVEDFRVVLDSQYDALVLGPGLVGESAPEINEIIRMAACPAVVDAGALDLLAGSLKNLRLVNGPRILTPHPGEMERIVQTGGRSRAELASHFVATFPCVLLLKGARTVVAAPGYPLCFNSTGTPGMGTGGMGDVLSGLVAALLAQGVRPMRSATIGAWLAGRAAELALLGGESEQSLSATHIPRYLGRAFESLRRGDF